MQDGKIRSHIAVVGAGFAGLAAGLELHNLGFAVTTVEARHRVGGRVWSTRLPNGAIVELGAEWIGPRDENVIEMAKRLDVPLEKVGVDFLIREAVNGAEVSSEDQQRVIQIAADTLAAIDKGTVAQSTLGEFVENLPIGEPERTLLRTRMQGSFGTDLRNIALRMLSFRTSPLRGNGSNADGDYAYFRASEGNQSLAEAMAAQLPDVHLGHIVTTIAHHQTGVTISGQAGDDPFEIEADAVIIAVPVKLLAELEFSPALPTALAEAFSSVPMGTAAKLAIGTENPPSLRAIQDVEMPYWCWTGRGKDGVVRRAVTAFCGSKQAQQNLATNSNDPSTWFGKLQSANRDLEFVDGPIMVDWSQDEWARGCYSAFDNTATDMIPLLSQPVGRLFFAGEHTAERSATMDGALSSGLRAAQQVVEVLL
jgi:monoamine oxidase